MHVTPAVILFLNWPLAAAQLAVHNQLRSGHYGQIALRHSAHARCQQMKRSRYILASCHMPFS